MNVEQLDPVISPAEFIDLKLLLEHQVSVPAHETLEAVYESFCQHPYEFVGVVEQEKLVGIVSRGQLGFILGRRFGFSIFGGDPVKNHLLQPCMAITCQTPLMEVLERALSRRGEEFYNDLALTDDAGRFIGIISVQTLVRVQSQRIQDQTRIAEARGEALEVKNKQLFRSLNELRQSRGRYEILFENSALGVALVNHRGEIETHNRRLISVLGIGPFSEPGRAPNLASLVAPKERAAFEQLLQLHENQGDTGFAVEQEFNLQLPGRGTRLFKFFTNAIPETGQLCMLLEDITEKRALERRMGQKEKSALLESLVGGVAHELNNKLSPVLGYAELLGDKLKSQHASAEMISFCDTIVQSAEESVKIIKQLLQLSRPVSAELRRCTLNDILSDALTVLHYRVRKCGAKLTLLTPADRAWVMADESQIKQVIMNLVINALDAMENCVPKELKISIVTENDTASLFISDTGHGIKPEHLTRIFDPFFTTKAPDRGTGLGLSVCFNILKQHGGDIVVKSSPGDGTVFQAIFPSVAPLPKDSHLAGSGKKSELLVMPENANFPPPCRVLVVDDEEWITSMVQEALRRSMGCRVERVHNGRKAIELLEQSSFDLIITDVRMPEMDGFALLEWIEQNRTDMISRTFFMTGDAGSLEMNDRMEKLGVFVLRKPFSIQKLLQQCRMILARSAQDAKLLPSGNREAQTSSCMAC